MDPQRKALRRVAIGCVIGCAAITSCVSTGALMRDRIASATERGDFLSATNEVRKESRRYGRRNQLLYHLDMGALFHYGEAVDSSIRYLNRAADMYTELFTRSVANEAASILTNDNIRPYRSKPYELVFMHHMLQVNFLLQGEVDKALVEARRTQLLFNEWDRKDRHDIKYDTDPMFHYISSIAYDAAGQTDNAMISLFHSVDAFRRGPVPLPREIGGHAHRMLVKNDRSQDTARLGLSFDSVSMGAIKNGASEIVLIGYAGRGPSLQEQVWWGTYVVDGLLILHHRNEKGEAQTLTLGAPPLIGPQGNREKTKSGTTFHIKVALPALVEFPSRTNNFSVRGLTPIPVGSIVINDLNKQAERHFEETRSAVVARTVVRTVLRTIAAQKSKEQLETQSPLANLFLNIGADILTDQLEKADVRSCGLIPATVHIVRIPVDPGTYSFEVDALGRAGQVVGSRRFSEVKVGKGEKKVVLYPSLF